MDKQIVPLVASTVLSLTGIGVLGGLCSKLMKEKRAAYHQGFKDGANLVKGNMEIKERLDKEAKQD